MNDKDFIDYARRVICPNAPVADGFDSPVAKECWAYSTAIQDCRKLQRQATTKHMRRVLRLEEHVLVDRMKEKMRELMAILEGTA